VLRTPTKETFNWFDHKKTSLDTIQNSWTVAFDSKRGGPAQPVVFEHLKDWSKENDPAIKYYSGTAVYTTTFDFKNTDEPLSKAYLYADNIASIAEVYVNGQECGVIWTAPYRVDITKALRPGKNELKIEVTNTWFNRMKGDLLLPEKERITQTNAPFWAKDKPLLPAGLLGPVTLLVEY
jgi:beta-galactosidase/beta-glucuronidase